MAKFKIYSPAGTEIYEGTPSFTGQYMSPGLLEFREIASPVPLDLVAGCYVDYTRTGFRYRIYGVPQVKKQARQQSYGGAFLYQNVQLYDASKMLEFCPFRDLVKGDNRIHFSTQPSISTFEGVDGLARRFEVCLQDQYGENSWRVRIATTADGISQDLADLMADAREFTVSGVNILECLNKVYEIWPEVGWVYTVENGVDTIVIGGAGLNANQGTYIYGKGRGLTALTRTVANADEMANRIFAYGSSRNMLPRWYNGRGIKDAESVDIQNLMIPVSEWGETEGDPDASKAYVENAESIAKIGLRPATVYFDGSGEYPEIYPSIRNATIGEVRTWIQLHASSPKWSPSTEIYPVTSERVDVLKSAQATFDSGLAGNTPGKANVEMGSTPFSASGSFTVGAGITYYPFYHYQGTWTPETSGIQTVAWRLDISGQVQLEGIEKVVVSVKVKDPSYQGPTILGGEYELTPDESGVVVLSGRDMYAEKVNVSAVSYIVSVDISVYMVAQSAEKTGAYTAGGNVGFALQNYRKKTFTVTLKQIGFDISEQAALGDGKTISMRSGSCVGRTFAIKSVQYNSASDDWTLECFRSEDESISQWFPNTDYPVREGDEFVLLDIAMPELYIGIASQKLLQAAQELLADASVERWQYVPEIDAKYMVENSRVIRAGEYMLLSDTAVIGGNPVSVLVDTVTINEGEAVIPTYKVTLRDRKRKTWTESESAPQSTSKSVGTIIETTQPQSSSGESFWTLDDNGNVTLKPQYENAWVPGWLAAGGIGQSSSGGSGLIETVSRWTDLQNMSTAPEDGTSAVFNSRAVYEVYQIVKSLQQSTPNVSLSNGNAYSTISVNGTSTQFYTKGQVDSLIANIDLSGYVTTQDLTTALSSYVTANDLTTAIGNINHLSSVTTNQDGTLDFNWASGDITRADLSHRHLDYEQAIASLRIWIDDGSGNLTLDTNKFTNVWVPGWLAAGGVGSGSGGGGGSQVSISNLLSSGTRVATITIDGTGYDILAPSGGSGGGSTVSVTQLQTTGTAIARISVDGADTTLYAPTSGGIASETDPVFSASAAAGITAANITAWNNKSDFSGSYNDLTNKPTIPTKVSQLTNDSGYLTSSDLSSLASRVTSIEDWFEIVNVGTTASPEYAIHVKQGRALYSDSWIAAGGVGSGSGSSGGTYVTWGTKSGYTRPLTVEGTTETLLLDGALTGYATQSWVQGLGYLTSSSLSDYATQQWVQDQGYLTSQSLADYVTLSTVQTITGAKTFSGGITMSGANILPSADDANSIGSSAYRFNAAHVRNIYTSYFEMIDGTSKASRGTLGMGDGYAQISLVGTNAASYMFYSTNGFFKQGGGVPLGRSDHRWSSVYSVDADLSGTLLVSGNATLSSNVYLGSSATATNDWANGQYLVWDSTNNAWHLVGNFYADGFVASGGIGANGNLSYELTTNKVTSLSSSSTDTQYPSAKAVYDHVDGIVGDIETLLAAI